jgi:hypothetical protein
MKTSGVLNPRCALRYFGLFGVMYHAIVRVKLWAALAEANRSHGAQA